MREMRRCLVGLCAALAIVALLAATPWAVAAQLPASVESADQYIANGNLKAAEIELRNAVRDAPQDAQLRIRLARVYLQRGDLISAEREARAARERNGAEADYLPVLDQALLRQGKFQELSDLVRPGNRPAALESQVRWALGMAAAGQHDNVRAQSLLQDAIRLDPKAAPPKIGLARLIAANNPAQANRMLDDVLAANPRAVEALEVKGELARARGDVQAAKSDFDAALRIDPQNAAARLSRASLNIAQGKYEAADEDLDPILKTDPNNFMANYLRAVKEGGQKQYAAADRLLDRLSPAFDQFPAGYYVQGAIKLELGQYAQAEAILAKYLDRARGEARAARLAAFAALRQRAPDRAIEYLKPLAVQSKAEADTLTLLGNAYMASGKPELALQQFEKAAALEPNNPTIETRMAISEIGVGQGKEGLAELERVFGKEAGVPIAGPTLVLAQLRAGWPDKAADVAAALVKRDGNNPLYLTLSGMVKAAQKDAAGAAAAFRAALAQNPDFTPAMNNLAALYLSSGRPDDAKTVYQAALVKKPDNENALLGLANVAIDQKKWSEATAYVNRARSAAPNDPAPGMAQVRIYALQANWTDAAAVAGALSAQFPRDPNIIQALAQAQFASGNINAAATSYKRAHELAPDSAPMLSRYLSLLISAKYYREADNVLREAIDRNPKNDALKADLVRITADLDGADAAVSRANLYAKDNPNDSIFPLVAAEVYENAGRWNDAANLLEAAAAAHPADAALTTALAALYDRTGHFSKAEALLAGQLKTNPKNAHAAVLLGSLYLKTLRGADAQRVYDALLAQRSNDFAARLGLADVAIFENKWSEAAVQIKQAAKLNPESVAPGLKLVELYIRRQDWKDATATATDLAAKFPDNIDVIDAEARAQIGAGDKPAAIASYKQAHELDPNSPKILARYVEALNSAKQYAESQSILRKALDRDPQNAMIKADLIQVAADIGGVEAALAEARDLAKKDPANLIYDMVSAELLDRAGRGSEAIGLLERDLASKPANDEVRAQLAMLYVRAGHPDKAETLLSARLKDDPANDPAARMLASLHLQSKDYDAAIAQYNKLLQSRPADPAALNNLAWLYQQKGDLAKARELAERAAAAAPNAPQIDDTLGWILLAQGDAAKAMTYLTAANVSAPADPSIAYHLAVALQRAGHSADARTVLEKLLGSGAAFAEKPEAEKLLADIKHS